MRPFICGDEAKIVSIREGDDLLIIERVTILVFHVLEGFNDGVEDHKEHDGTQRIALENSSFK